ncbi:hypothetical protein BKA83DRAFT_4124227 [Pisolithus microcarpus]|nr:hypothetical protein BKA83DRAFT_4124227 [Pisolithus microcarpus]
MAGHGFSWSILSGHSLTGNPPEGGTMTMTRRDGGGSGKSCGVGILSKKGDITMILLTSDVLWQFQLEFEICGGVPQLASKGAEVIKKVGSHAFHLTLPASWSWVHPIFHTALLHPYHPPVSAPAPPPILVGDHYKLEVKALMNNEHGVMHQRCLAV